MPCLTPKRVERDRRRTPARRAPRRTARASAAPSSADTGRFEHDDAAERRRGIGGERRCVGLLDRRRDGDAARVRVLDDHARRQRELAREQACGGEVVEVVVRELLAVQLLDAREQVHAGARLRVVRGTLVRVLAVRELGHLRERRDEALGEELDLVEPAVRSPPRTRRSSRTPRPRASAASRAESRRAPAARRRTTGYWSGRQTGATCAKFFAAARSIEGPPTSIISTASSSLTPRSPTTSAKG